MEFHLAPSTKELLGKPTVTRLFKIIHTLHGKGKALHAWRGPEGSRKLRFPDFMTTA